MAQQLQRRTRGVQDGARSRRVVESVRRATIAELARVGYAQLTMGSVAAAAGVNRTTIYRRWPTKADLVASLMEPQFERFAQATPSDTLAGDLTALVKLLGENLASVEGKAVTRVLTSTSPDLEDLARTAQRRAMSVFEAAFARARERGELSAEADLEMLVHLAFFGAVHWVREGVPSDEDCRRLVRTLLGTTLDGARPGPG